MILLYAIIFLSQPDFESKLSELKNGQKITKSFATQYLNAQEEFYGQYFEYSTKFKPNFQSEFLSLIFKESTGVCGKEYLTTFDKNGQIRSQLEISHQCDQDGADPTSKSWTYQLNIEDRLLYLFVTVESVVDKSLIDDSGLLTEGNFFGDLETETIEQIETYEISKTGEISKK